MKKSGSEMMFEKLWSSCVKLASNSPVALNASVAR